MLKAYGITLAPKDVLAALELLRHVLPVGEPWCTIRPTTALQRPVQLQILPQRLDRHPVPQLGQNRQNPHKMQRVYGTIPAPVVAPEVEAARAIVESAENRFCTTRTIINKYSNRPLY
jgi:hypothetical protein